MNLKPDAQKFADEILRRKITSLVHFTPALNLTSIFEGGEIISRQRLDLLRKDAPQLHLDDYVELNDAIRLDGRPDYINLSVQFPNFRLFERFRQKHRDDVDAWAIILIKPVCIQWNDTLFSVYNAASRCAKDQGIGGSFQHFQQMFKNNLSLYNQSSSWVEMRTGLAECYPTSIQAEVLVKTRIPNECITSIVFQSAELAGRYRAAAGIFGDTSSIPFIANAELFGRARAQEALNGI
ncbi:hypothetical protein PDESU_03202 [Pontiella desulfatans]|uniref:DarT domain-containing protein n=1 Tax=Pontiella desulfatans TaxID=2750659 RepID=A0A6C2U487_PONDE|nr:DarT ssDNA thymidine ADP-ribosyltransferase family protein [Pontiella desulfatans]VGO14637.1 hypothetical protein PDESU_03202 [Pontiella desulfatans]